MGVCDSDSNQNKIYTDNINIIKNDIMNNKEKKINLEGLHECEYIPTYFNEQKLGIIVNQKDNSVCKIIKNDIPAGTGFLCYIPGILNKRIVLITAYHVIDDKDLYVGNELYLSFNDNKNPLIRIKIDKTRHIYANKDYDITILEIKDYDKFKNNYILEIDNSLIDINSKKLEEIYNQKEIYILHYPKCLRLFQLVLLKK